MSFPSRWLWLVPGLLPAAVLLAPAAEAAEEPTTYFLGRNVYQDFESFLGAEALASRTYAGRDRAGTPCSFRVARTADRIVFTPLNVAAPAELVVPNRPGNQEITGGFQGNRLWAYRFVDRPGSRVHGMYGWSTVLGIEKTGNGAIAVFQFSYSEKNDLANRPLVRFECLNPR
jgi:hypothetical protein